MFTCICFIKGIKVKLMLFSSVGFSVLNTCILIKITVWQYFDGRISTDPWNRNFHPIIASGTCTSILWVWYTGDNDPVQPMSFNMKFLVGMEGLLD